MLFFKNTQKKRMGSLRGIDPKSRDTTKNTIEILIRLHRFYEIMADFFEIDRLTEDLAKFYSSQLAVSWFKVNNQKTPTKDEFREMVVIFMKDFENTLSRFPDTDVGIRFKNYSMNQLQQQIQTVLDGKNKEVEKRYKYYAEYN